MTANWWKIAKLEVLLALKDKESFIWSFVAPLLFTAFIGYAFNNEKTPGPIRIAYDGGGNPEYVGSIFKNLLEKDGIVISSGDNLPVLSVPDSLVYKILEGKSTNLSLRVGEESRNARAVSAKTRKILYFLIFSVKPDWLTAPPAKEKLDSMLADTGPIGLNITQLGGTPRRPSGVERTLPSVVVMFLLFSLFTFYASLWVEDTKTGKMKRILFSPSGMKSIFAAQISSRMLWGILQVIVVGSAATLIFGIKWELPFVNAGLLVLVYMFAVTALGMLFSSFFSSPEKANAMGVVLSLAMSALGGCWWPLEIVPGFMKIAALFTPTGLAMDAFGSFLADGRAAAFPAFNVVCLGAIGIIIMPLAVHRMKRQLTA